MVVYCLALIGGVIALVWSAERFVTGAAAIAAQMGVSSLVIGLTVVSFGTSAPEILVSASAALKGSPGLAVGNALGSNLANIGLVLALTILLKPINVNRGLVSFELPILLLFTLATGWVLWDNHLGRLESILLLLGLLGFTTAVLWRARRGKTNQGLEEQIQGDAEGGDEPAPMSKLKAWSLTLIGLAVLLVASNILVWSASAIAVYFKIPELIIGFTVVAVGTSLPELAASIAGALKGEGDIALGNVVGSNLFNFLAVLPVAGVIAPAAIVDAHFYRDFGSVALLTALLGAFCWYALSRPRPTLGPWMGSLMLAIYIGYYCILIVVA